MTNHLTPVSPPPTAGWMVSDVLPWMSEALDALARHPRLATMGALLTIAAIAAVDLSVWEISFGVFYLLPILVVAWVQPRVPTLLLSFAVAALSVTVGGVTGRPYSQAWMYGWRVATSGALYCLAALLLTVVRDLYHTERWEGRTDRLTGLSNRGWFFKQGEAMFHAACANNLPLTVVMLDCDHFKSINDTGGHAAGDQALVAVSECIRSTLGPLDIAGRIGGDEFALLLPGITAQMAAIQLRHLIGPLAAGCVTARPLTVSGGVVTFSGTAGNLDGLMASADRLLYQAKRQEQRGLRFGEYRDESGVADTTPLARSA